MSVAPTRHNWSPEDRQTYEALQAHLAEENAKLGEMNGQLKVLDMEQDRQRVRVEELARDLRNLEREFDHKHYAKGARSW
jgi:hypothetical protein